jgi:hypothetical protein
LTREVKQIADQPARRTQGQRSSDFFAHIRLNRCVRAWHSTAVLSAPGKGKPFSINRLKAAPNSRRRLFL